MESKLIIKKRSEDLFEISGILDDSALFDPLIRSKSKNIKIIFGTIRRVTSLGVKQWVIFLNKMKGRHLVLEKCNTLIIEQINMISDFLGDAYVSSFYIPMLCESCGKETEQEIQADYTLTENFVQKLDKDFKCKCGHCMKFDDSERVYFSFLKKNQLNKKTT